jgi:hypothetical protein
MDKAATIATTTPPGRRRRIIVYEFDANGVMQGREATPEERRIVEAAPVVGTAAMGVWRSP